MLSEYESTVRALHQQVNDLVAHPVLHERPDPLERLGVAVRVESTASALVVAAVGAARTQGVAWQRIGEVLGVTRQAAFQRFGKPIDPRTGETMNPAPLAHATEINDVILDELVASQWDDIVERFDPAMRSALTPDALAAAWSQVIRTAGAFETRGMAAATRLGEVTVVETPLHFEAGEFVARVSLRDDASIAGFFLVAPDAA